MCTERTGRSALAFEAGAVKKSRFTKVTEGWSFFEWSVMVIAPLSFHVLHKKKKNPHPVFLNSSFAAVMSPASVEAPPATSVQLFNLSSSTVTGKIGRSFRTSQLLGCFFFTEMLLASALSNALR